MVGGGHFLLLDQGSHASKAFVVGADGRWLGSGACDLASREPHPGWCEHDPLELLASVRRAVDGAMGRAAASAAGVTAGVATQRSTVVCWDRQTGEALSPVISWQDRRHAAWLDGLGLDPGEVRRITGLVPSPHYGASKLRWCLDHLPAVGAAREAGSLCLGPLSSYLLFSLLDQRPFVVDPANASRTLLWDVGTRAWSPVMVERFGIPAECLPACVPSRHAYGSLPAPGGPVTVEVCTGDQAAALFAQGRPRPDSVYVNIGTGAFVQRPADGEPPVVSGLLQSVAWQDGEGSLAVLEGTVNGAGAALDWLAGHLETPVEGLLAQADRWLADVGEVPLFINGVGGLGSPFWRPGCPIRFEGDGDAAARTVAVLESIAFLVVANLEAMEAALGPARRIVVTGGLAALDGLCLRLAELGGVPVERPPQLQATSLGLARLLGLSDAGSATPSDVFEPPRPGPATGRYRAWRAAMELAAGG